MKGLVKNFIIFFAVFILLAALFSALGPSTKEAERVGTEVFIGQIENEEIESITVEGSKINVTLRDGREELVKKESGETLSELLKNFDVSKEKIAKIKIEVKENEGFSFWAGAILPFLLPFLLGLWGVLYFQFFCSTICPNGILYGLIPYWATTAREGPRRPAPKAAIPRAPP